MNFGFQGLSDEDVDASRRQHGRNEMQKAKKGFAHSLLEVLKEPMIVLLLAAALLYFFSGDTGDALFMVAAIFAVAGISLYQERRSSKALELLRSLTETKCRVIRQGQLTEIKKDDIVIGDYLVVEEGNAVPADGKIVHSNDFSVNESSLTGESAAVAKNKTSDNNLVYQGTTVVSGLAVLIVTAIAGDTELGKIDKSLQTIELEKTPLQIQIQNFVSGMALAGVVVFLIVWAINYFDSKLFMDSLLKALTLAMSVLPEEIPVAFATFMALGAWRLTRLGIIVRNTKTIETLGSATVICLDKTGTITENRMTIAKVYNLAANSIVEADKISVSEHPILTAAMWASEPAPFDPMEKALHALYGSYATPDERSDYKMIHEYPLDGVPPIMTHIFARADGHRIVAAKGAPEGIESVSRMGEQDLSNIRAAVESMASEGYRVLGVATASLPENDWPKRQQEIVFDMLGLVAFYDPPKRNIEEVFNSFRNAGIMIKMITGDNAATAFSVAKQVKLTNTDEVVEGQALLGLSDKALKDVALRVNVFARMFPNAKLKILHALKEMGHIVAMTGDGVNDAPALKAAHIGIAMGRKGTELAKEVSSLIITDDDLARMVDAVAMGRKIYGNLKKAIQYIITIHIPIILTVFIPLVLGWMYPAIFTPVHVIFLELIMGPTCSIVYENEPLEDNMMSQPPRPFTKTFFNMHELATSIVQGVAISAGVLGVYQFGVSEGESETGVRSMVFIALVSANVFLTLANRSPDYPVYKTLRYANRLVPVIILITIAVTVLLFVIPSFASFFQFGKIDMRHIIISVISGMVSVLWFDVVKILRMRFHRSRNKLAP